MLLAAIVLSGPWQSVAYLNMLSNLKCAICQTVAYNALGICLARRRAVELTR